MALDIARAWKDAEYRKSLTAEELASLPENPAGTSELSDADLSAVSGGKWSAPGQGIGAGLKVKTDPCEGCE